VLLARTSRRGERGAAERVFRADFVAQGEQRDAEMVAAVDVIGFLFDGTNPNGSKYAGVAVVEATGQTYLITWTVGGSKSVGRGVFLDKTLAVGGVLGSGGFVFAMSPKNGNLEGVWADMQRGTTLGAEVWTRVK